VEKKWIASDVPAYRKRTIGFWVLHGFSGLATSFFTGLALATTVSVLMPTLPQSADIWVGMVIGLAFGVWVVHHLTYRYPFGHPVRFDVPAVLSHPVASPLLNRIDELLNRQVWGLGSSHSRSLRAARWVRYALENKSLNPDERMILQDTLGSLTLFSRP
jgi:hypothetical protein